ncbi:MAG: nucleoside-diphosphate kinase [Chlamydiales bacterium]
MFKLLCFAAASLFAEQTLSIIKPDAVEKDQLGEIDAYLESSELHVVAAKMVQLTPEEAREFYAVHKDRPFYNDLVQFMTSGPILVQVLEGDDAVARNRRVMGATDPAKAEPGTIRADFGTDVQRNAVHGSDSLENARKEIAFFFESGEIYSRSEEP